MTSHESDNYDEEENKPRKTLPKEVLGAYDLLTGDQVSVPGVAQEPPRRDARNDGSSASPLVRDTRNDGSIVPPRDTRNDGTAPGAVKPAVAAGQQQKKKKGSPLFWILGAGVGVMMIGGFGLVVIGGLLFYFHPWDTPASTSRSYSSSGSSDSSSDSGSSGTDSSPSDSSPSDSSSGGGSGSSSSSPSDSASDGGYSSPQALTDAVREAVQNKDYAALDRCALYEGMEPNNVDMFKDLFRQVTSTLRVKSVTLGAYKDGYPKVVLTFYPKQRMTMGTTKIKDPETLSLPVASKNDRYYLHN